MLIRVSRKLYRDGSSTRIGLPKIWTDSLGLNPGDEVEIAYNGVGLFVIAPASTGAARVLRAMREGR